MHISFEDSKKYFRNFNKLFLTGNPIRSNLVQTKKDDALKEFGLSPLYKTLLIIGDRLAQDQ